MDTKATATLRDGSKVSGRLTTAHSASSYGQPVFVDDAGQAYNWSDIVDVNTAAELGRKGGSSTSKAKQKSSANNGRLGGRPKGSKNKPAA
jgi:hypothetical protein